jgi:predicted enzyme related to lactoylglutathione lyase
MPTPTTLPGAPCWIELLTSDPDRARTFYGSLLGWTFEEPNPDFGGYSNANLAGGRIAGMMDKRTDPGMEGIPDSWSIYLRVEDAAATAEAIRAAGGEVGAGPMPIADLGTMLFCTDPTGAPIGGWQAGTHTGFAVVDEHGAPSWCELFTRDHAAAIAFYEAAFGWTTQVEGDTDEFRYSTLVDGDGEQHAGVMDASAWLPDGVPSHWSVYFRTDDIDATLAQATELGGSIVVPAEDTPYGRLATCTDPTGATFKLRG